MEMLKSKIWKQFIWLTVILFSITACKKDSAEPVVIQEEDILVVTVGTLELSTSDGDWITSEVKIEDNGDGVIYFNATSTLGGELNFQLSYMGLGTFSFEELYGGNLNFTSDTTSLDNMYHYEIGMQGTPEAVVNFTAHDKMEDEISGTFDFWLVDTINNSDLIHLQGELLTVPVTPRHPTFESMTATVNNFPFERDYDMLLQNDSSIILILAKDLEQTVALIINHPDVESLTQYDFSNPSQENPFLVLFFDLPDDFYFGYNEGIVNIDDNQSGYPQFGIPGHISGTYAVVVENDLGETKSLEGEFDVNY